MSVYNKATDRNDLGRIHRKFTRNHEKKMSTTPKWWMKEFMNQPKRRTNKRICIAIMNGKDPDSLVYPVGNRKPHYYYW